MDSLILEDVGIDVQNIKRKPKGKRNKQKKKKKSGNEEGGGDKEYDKDEKKEA